MKRLTAPSVLIVLALTASLLSGCAGLRAGQRLSEYQDTARLYKNAIRWNNFEGALSFLRHPNREAKAQDLNRLAQLRVTDYETAAERASPDGRSVEATVVIQYLWLDQMAQLRIVDHQHWVYVDKLKRWELDGGLPQFN